MERLGVKYITEEGWEGRVQSHTIWEGETKEDIFKKMLKTNHNFLTSKQYKSYEFENYDIQDQYDEWWAKLTEEEKIAIQGGD